MTKKFKHIDPPYGFRDFYSKYPHGYSIYEALLEWVQQVNDLTENVNELNSNYGNLLEFVNTQLQQYAQEQLLEWLNNGILETLINETLFNTKLDKSTYEAHNIANVKDFGALGDGVADDTSSIQQAVDYISLKGGGTVHIPAGVYMIKAEDVNNELPHLWDTGGIILKNNITIKMDHNTHLKAIKSTQGAYHIFTIYRKNNITITGGNLEGERLVHEGNIGEFGFGIAINGDCSNILIEDVNLKNFWGDGIHLNNRTTNTTDYPKNVTIRRVVSENNRRQGMSIVAGKNIRVENSIFKNMNGILPETGIDIEPWTNQTVCEDISIINCKMIDNNKEGLLVTSAGFGEIIKRVYVQDCVISGNKSTVGQVWVHDDTREVVLDNCYITNSTGEYALTTTGGEVIVKNSSLMGGGVASTLFNGKASLVVENTKINAGNKLLAFAGGRLIIKNSTLTNFAYTPFAGNLLGSIVENGGTISLRGGTIRNTQFNYCDKTPVELNSGTNVVDGCSFLGCGTELYNANIHWLGGVNQVLNNLFIPSVTSQAQMIIGTNIANSVFRNNTLHNKTGVDKTLSWAIFMPSSFVDFYNQVSDYGIEGDIKWDKSVAKLKVCTSTYKYDGSGVFVPAVWQIIGGV